MLNGVKLFQNGTNFGILKNLLGEFLKKLFQIGNRGHFLRFINTFLLDVLENILQGVTLATHLYYTKFFVKNQLSWVVLGFFNKKCMDVLETILLGITPTAFIYIIRNFPRKTNQIYVKDMLNWFNAEVA